MQQGMTGGWNSGSDNKVSVARIANYEQKQGKQVVIKDVSTETSGSVSNLGVQVTVASEVVDAR